MKHVRGTLAHLWMPHVFPLPLLVGPPCVVIVLQEVQQANILPAKCLILIIIFVVIDTENIHICFSLFLITIDLKLQICYYGLSQYNWQGF